MASEWLLSDRYFGCHLTAIAGGWVWRAYLHLSFDKCSRRTRLNLVRKVGLGSAYLIKATEQGCPFLPVLRKLGRWATSSWSCYNP